MIRGRDEEPAGSLRTDQQSASPRTQDTTGSEPAAQPTSQDWQFAVRNAPKLDDAALYGLAGEVIHMLAPTTEAHPAAMLFSLLAAIGTALGNQIGWQISGVLHPLRLFVVLIGLSGRGRKGSSWGAVRSTLEAGLGETFIAEHVNTGLSSGEGLIHALRDGQVDDKRLLVLETEFGRVLKALRREGNTLSAVVRQAWDLGPSDALSVLTKISYRATGAHIGMIGHCTQQELLTHLTDTETANGFANRFLWVHTERAQILPFGGQPDPDEVDALGRRLQAALSWASGHPGPLTWHASARETWADIYTALGDGAGGLSGAVQSRADVNILRLAGIYAVLDMAQQVRPEHLEAAVAAWEYCASSVDLIFGNSTGNPLADQIIALLETHGRVTRTQLSNLLGRNRAAASIDNAVNLLLQSRRVRMTHGTSRNGGRVPTYLELEVSHG